MFTGKRPTDDRFGDGLSLHRYAKTALSSHVIDILDPSLQQDEEEAIYTTDNDRSITLHEKAKQCWTLIIRIGVACSQELPQERMNIKDVNMNLQLIRDTFFKH